MMTLPAAITFILLIAPSIFKRRKHGLPLIKIMWHDLYETSNPR